MGRKPIEIESGIPIEHGSGRHNPETADIYAAASKLERGQSFLIPAQRFTNGMTTNFNRKFGGTFSRRTITTGPDAGNVRIWRRI